MPNPLAALLLFGLLYSPAPKEEVALDAWTGTLEMRGESIYLRRCSLGNELYELKPLSDEKIFLDLPLSHIKAKRPVTVTAIASYETGEKNSNVLRVSSFMDLELDKSCHLSDFFG